MNISEQLKAILYQALGEPIGLLIQCNDWNKARQAFYRARAEANDPALSQLQIRVSPGIEGGNLIIVNQKVEVNSKPATLTEIDL